VKLRHIASMAIVPASLFVAGITLAAQDRFALKAPNGIAFSEFKGYEAWQMVASSQPDGADGCGSSPAPGCIKSILGNPAMIKAYSDGIPANGKAVPDGAALAKIEWRKSKPASAYAVTVPGTFSEVSFMLKDSKRFPDTKGWGFATFRYDAASDTFSAFGANPAFGKTCLACHTFVQDRDFVFTNYAKR
jgi:Cytochrome P460